MAFSLEEIETALAATPQEWCNFIYDRFKFIESINYPVIIDYLSGHSNSLATLQNEHPCRYWGKLIFLIKDIEIISADEQLVLDIIKHPLFNSSLVPVYLHWLKFYLIKHSSPATFKAVHRQFHAMGCNDDVMVDYFVLVNNSGPAGRKYTDRDQFSNGDLKTFLVDHIKTWKTIRTQPSHFPHDYRHWNFKLFFLLEEANPAMAEEYALHAILHLTDVVLFFSSYRDAMYMPLITAELINGKSIEIYFLQKKFTAAIRFFQEDAEKYLPVALTLANQYLDFRAAKLPNEVWEYTIQLDEFKNTDQYSLTFSACAFHLLFKYQKENGLQKINQWKQDNVFMSTAVLKIIIKHFNHDAFPFLENTLHSARAKEDVAYLKEAIYLICRNTNSAQYLPVFWYLIANKSKIIRQVVAVLIAQNDPEGESKAIALLHHKNSETRLTAAIILSNIATPSAKAAIMKVLNSELNDNTRDVLLETVADNLPTEASMAFIEDMVSAAKSRSKMNKPVEPWLEESTLPPLFYSTGKQLTADEIRFLLYRMSRIKTMQSDMEARYILQFLDKTTSNGFALAIFKLFIANGAKPEHKWLMALAALTGDDMVVDKIRITINNWIEENRYKMAEHGVGALAIQGSDKALRWVEWYSRKYKSKKANVGAAALVALETAATELGITIHELGDRVVPDFGFDGLFKTFTVDGEEYRAFIDSNFKMAFFNEDDKKIKAIPAATDASIKDEFKAIAKEVRDIVKSQSSRLEYYVIIQRKWTYDQWQKFFLQNPVMFIYATKLLWGVYNVDGELQNCFMCSEDTSLINLESDEISVDENCLIGIVHPTQLPATLLKQWQQQFYDLSIELVFPQLDRKTPDMNGIDLSKPIIKIFEGKQMQTGSTRSTLERFGWHKGPTGDGGYLESFNLLYFEKKLEAVLEVEGIAVGYGWGGEEKLGRLYVIDKTKVTGRWGMYVKDESDEKLMPLNQVPAIFLNEMLAAIQAIKPFEKPAG